MNRRVNAICLGPVRLYAARHTPALIHAANLGTTEPARTVHARTGRRGRRTPTEWASILGRTRARREEDEGTPRCSRRREPSLAPASRACPACPSAIPRAFVQRACDAVRTPAARTGPVGWVDRTHRGGVSPAPQAAGPADRPAACRSGGVRLYAIARQRAEGSLRTVRAAPYRTHRPWPIEWSWSVAKARHVLPAREHERRTMFPLEDASGWVGRAAGSPPTEELRGSWGS